MSHSMRLHVSYGDVVVEPELEVEDEVVPAVEVPPEDEPEDVVAVFPPGDMAGPRGAEKTKGSILDKVRSGLFGSVWKR